ncbi:MAG: hypothetical protein KDE20_20605 [Caldilineaceae bacterium]|nr:hypothetical protein [Caldilineaceae bacterium]MCB9161710.1 hypothetical protein [Caldilineaceae bacterium]
MSAQQMVSPAMAADLDARVKQAGGDIAAVRHEVEDKLHAMEAQEEPADQVQIALLLGEIDYLDAKAEAAQQSVQEKHVGLMDRIRHMFGGQG